MPLSSSVPAANRFRLIAAPSQPAAAQTPVIDDGGTSGTGGTLASGTYYYRVSAVIDPSLATSPLQGGETLASDELPVTVGTNGKATIGFACVADAVKYKIYRTPNPNAPSGTERLLGTVTASCSGTPLRQSFVDAGMTTSTAQDDITFFVLMVPPCSISWQQRV